MVTLFIEVPMQPFAGVDPTSVPPNVVADVSFLECVVTISTHSFSLWDMPKNLGNDE